MWDAKVAVLVPLRVGAGQFMLAQAMQQIAAGWLQQPLVMRHLETVRSGEHAVPVQAQLAELVLRYPMFWSVATCTGLLVLGLCLGLGLLARPAAMLALIGYLLCGLLLGARLFDSGTVLLCLSLVSLSMVASGRVLGLDMLLRKRLPAWLT
jgi:hypothetical protein